MREADREQSFPVNLSSTSNCHFDAVIHCDIDRAVSVIYCPLETETFLLAYTVQVKRFRLEVPK